MTPPWDRRDTRTAAFLAVLAFGVRGMLALLTPVIGADAGAFLIAAREISQGDWTPSLGSGIHPGYPLAIALVGSFTGSLETGAYVVSVLFSSLAVLSLYALVRDMADRRIAVLSCLLYACLRPFIQEHADIMTEGFFHFLFVTSIALAWFGAARARCSFYVLAGFTGALAYLVRPEGVYTVVAMIGVTVLTLVAWLLRRERPALRTLGFAAISLAVFLFIAFPLLLWFHHHTGSWKITHRESADLAMGVRPPRGDRTPTLRTYIKPLMRVTGWYLAPLPLVGLIFLKGRLRPLGAVFLGCLAFGYAFAPAMAAMRGYALSHRYILVTLIFLLPFIALGCVGLVDFLARRWSPKRVRLAASAAFGLLLLAFLIQTIRPRRSEEVGIRDASLWLRGQLTPTGAVYANSGRAGYYVGRRILSLPTTPVEIENVTLGAGDFILVVEPDYRKDARGGLEILEARYRRVARFPPEENAKLERVSVFAP